jgi:hypothetical protein
LSEVHLGHILTCLVGFSAWFKSSVKPNNTNPPILGTCLKESSFVEVYVLRCFLPGLEAAISCSKFSSSFSTKDGSFVGCL